MKHSQSISHEEIYFGVTIRVIVRDKILVVNCKVVSKQITYQRSN